MNKVSTNNNFKRTFAGVFIAAAVGVVFPAGAGAAVVTPGVVKPHEVTPHAVPSKTAPAAPTAPNVPPAPGGSVVPQPSGGTQEPHFAYVVPNAGQREKQAEENEAKQFADAITGQDLPQRPTPDLTLPPPDSIPPPVSTATPVQPDTAGDFWGQVLRSLVGGILERLCPSPTLPGATGYVEDPHDPGSCF
jgi:hypothetical protein